MKKVFVLDTSVLLHDPKAMFCFEDNEVVIPYAVLEELEHKKRLLDDVGRLARQVIRYLDQLREGGQLAQGVALPGRGKLRIELNHSSGTILPLLSDLSLPDNRILAVTLNLANEDERPVILVTKDITMRVKADALSVQTEDFYNDKMNLTPLDEEVMVINLKDDEAAELYEKGSLPLAPIAALKEFSPIRWRFRSWSPRTEPNWSISISVMVVPGAFFPKTSSRSGRCICSTIRKSSWSI
ncbi:hypothetical protein SDC9_11193 [bioreactor metagenome]|uniref:PIN domain-containing protein n=1 Tax=bioreactor metagenome TaxID=1076179 RepID=A0A644TFN0_9ZZZZ